MFLNTNFLCLKKTYIIFFITLLFIILTISKVYSSTFKVSKIQVVEPFDNSFKKKAVIDKAIELAFKKLLRMTVSSNEMSKISNYSVDEIKKLIDSFTIKDEKFINETYNATFDVNFNKQNTFLFIEKKNIFPSIPNKKKIIILPILVDTSSQNINIFNQNPFYDNWNSDIKDYHLIEYILPSEDIDVVKVLNENYKNLEDYNFNKIVKDYNLEEYIICFIYKDDQKFKIFSKIKLNNKLKIKSKIFAKKNIYSPKELENFIDNIKIIYENEWKEVNKINRSVKLPINLFISSKDYKKNDDFEKFLSKTDLVSKYLIKSFNNKRVNYKIIFNGSPKEFLNIAKNNNFLIDTDQQVWRVN